MHPNAMDQDSIISDPTVQERVSTDISPPENLVIVFVDLETSGLNYLSAEVCQIAGKSGSHEFNAYVVPPNGIPEDVSNITHLTVRDGLMYSNGKLVDTTSPRSAWLNFIDFISSLGREIVLVAHNGYRSDFPIIIREMIHYNFFDQFKSVVKGLADTYVIIKKDDKEKQEKEMKSEDKKSEKIKKPRRSFSQTNLAKFYGISNDFAHNALGDVRVLSELVSVMNISTEKMSQMAKPVEWITANEERLEMIRSNSYSLWPIEAALSEYMQKKIAAGGISLQTLRNAYYCGGDNGILMLLTEDVGGKARVTKKKRIIEAITQAIAKICE